MALWNELSGLKRLLALKAAGVIGSGVDWATVSGEAPLSLPSAIAKGIKRLVQYGKTTQSTTPTPSSPVDIVCNNGVVKMLNLAYMAESNLDIGYYINNNGARTSSASNFYTIGYVAVKPNTTYTMHLSGSVNYFNTMEYGTDKSFIKRTLYGSTGTPAGDTTTFTTGSTTYFLRWGSNMDGNTVTYDTISALTWMLSEGSTAKDYAPFGTLYIDGTPEVLTVSASGADSQTASVVDLYSVGDYADEQDIISGAVTHKCGIKVLDGTETGWALSDSGSTHRFRGTKPSDCHTPASRAPSVCTHFKYVSTGSAAGGMFIGASAYWYFIPTDQTIDTVDDWKAWLASQYAAGTPVIVLYPLAEQTTESVTAQHLATAVGDNVVSVVSEVDPVDLEVEYAKAVST